MSLPRKIFTIRLEYRNEFATTSIFRFSRRMKRQAIIFVDTYSVRNANPGAGIPMVFGLFLKKQKFSSMLGGKLSEFRGAMRIVAKDKCIDSKLVGNNFIFPSLVCHGMVTIIDEQVNTRNGAERFNRISIENPSNFAVWASQKKTSLVVDVRPQIDSRVAFTLVTKKRGT